MICSAELHGLSILRFHPNSGQASGDAVGVEATEAEGLVPKALPEREEDLIETALVHSARPSAADSAVDSVVLKERSAQAKAAESRSAVGWAAGKAWPEARFVHHSARRSAATAVAEDSAAGSVVLKEHFVPMKEAESRSAVGWAAEKAWPEPRFVHHSARRLVAIAAAEDSAAGLVVAKERFDQVKEVGLRLAVRSAAEKAWPKARFEAVVVHSAGRWAASAAAEDSAAGSVVAKEHFVRVKDAWSRPAVVRKAG